MADLSDLVADRDQLFALTSRLAAELEDLSRATCWSNAGFDTCINDGCEHRRALIADARGALTGADRG